MSPRLLIVSAVDAEAAAIAEALEAVPEATTAIDILVGGVGPAAAAATASAALARRPYDLVLSAGIAGGFAPVQPGDIAVASAVVFADLGAETADSFAPISTLGFGQERHAVAAEIAERLAGATGGQLGTILTVATVTGTAATAAAMALRFPDAVAEAMEGFGVAEAAALLDVQFGELRAISNVVGPRDRDAWQIPAALEALGRAVDAVAREWLA